jgi:hypothetical protein
MACIEHPIPIGCLHGYVFLTDDDLSDTTLRCLSITAILFSVSAIYNTTVVWHLNVGWHSYDSNEKIWKSVLGISGERPMA